MNDLNLSMTTKKLFSAARADMPSAAARAKVWAGVSGAIGGAAGASAASVTASSVIGGGATATKVLTFGGLFGGTLAVGLAATLLKFGSAPPPPQYPTTSPSPMAQVAPAPPPALLSPGLTAASHSQRQDLAAISTSSAPPVPNRNRLAKPAASEGSLAREASLVAVAHGALGRGDPQAALRAIAAARALSSRQLVPEELAVQEQALRALGESDEANGIDVQLRLQYPESALAR